MSKRSSERPSVAQVRADAARVLARVRGLDDPGALVALDRDEQMRRLLAAWPGPDQKTALAAIQQRVAELADMAECLGCGTCCRVSSPTLYQTDADLVAEDRLAKQSLYTLRAGEMVHSARLGRVEGLEQDLIKVREISGGCALLQGSRCTAYGHRPLQCRHLECWSGKNAGDLEHLERLGRQDLYQNDQIALDLMAEYDLKINAVELADVLSRAAQEDREAATDALEVIRLDLRLRAGISQRYGYSPHELELILGRSALQVAGAHGLRVDLDPIGDGELRPLGGARPPK